LLFACHNFFSYNDILHPTQHGFLKGKSTCTNLMEFMNDWTLSIQYKCLVTVIYIDFSQAFDAVSHDKLLIRLNAYRVTGMLLKWIQEFLSNRTHCIRIGSALSSSTDLFSGVIQRSGIGPLLFLMYINELAKILQEYGVTIKCLPMIPRCTLISLILLILHDCKPPQTGWYSGLRHGS